jgi:hypothetical protein
LKELKNFRPGFDLGSQTTKSQLDALCELVLTDKRPKIEKLISEFDLIELLTFQTNDTFNIWKT